MLREKFLAADAGITGANFLVAETGSAVIVTNEGNGDLTQTLARVHIVVASLEKIVPTLEDTTTILRLLARSATGQECATYTTFSCGPRRPGDVDGPEEYHVVLLDNGRSELLASDFRPILRCIRCGACMNHCPVYQAVGGHAYGWVYPGPVGAVLTPALIGIAEAAPLPEASTFCGRCEEVCPMQIPLPGLLRKWRMRAHEAQAPGTTPWQGRLALRAWGWLARHPRLYQLAARLGVGIARGFWARYGRLVGAPFTSAWTRYRDLPAPEGGTFQARWRRHQRHRQLSSAQWRHKGPGQ